jgi:hypothetical protein
MDNRMRALRSLTASMPDSTTALAVPKLSLIGQALIEPSWREMLPTHRGKSSL